MLANIRQQEVRTNMLKMFMKGDDDFLGEWMTPGKQRWM
jgi:hypothetical protein